MNLPVTNLDPKYQVLKDVFGFDGFRPGQEEAVDAILMRLSGGVVHGVLLIQTHSARCAGALIQLPQSLQTP